MDKFGLKGGFDSHWNCVPDDLLHHLLCSQHLLDEQMLRKKGMYLMSFGTDIDPLWPVVRDVNDRMWVKLVIVVTYSFRGLGLNRVCKRERERWREEGGEGEGGEREREREREGMFFGLAFCASLNIFTYGNFHLVCE